MKFYSLILSLLVSVSALAFDHTHKIWDELLQKNVVLIREGQASRIDYAKIDLKTLQSYTQASLKVSQKEVEAWTKEQQLAYYFNLYNALTVERILSKYPDIESIKELGSGLFTSTWKVKWFDLFGEKSYLDRIEHELVRGSGKFNEPLVHVAFNCASIGCPALLNKAFVAENLENQLQTAMKNFLSDRDRNRYDEKEKILYVSKIFDWYEEDFEKGWRGFSDLKTTFSKYAEQLGDSPEAIKAIAAKDYKKIKHLDYDWNLNDTKSMKKLTQNN